MRLRLPVLASVLTLSSVASAAEDVSTGGRVETDLYTNPESPPEALIDNNIKTHFAQHRVEDSDWRLWLKTPSQIESVSFVQGWQDWSLATKVRLESADGSTVELDLQTGTRDPQVFPVTFKNPTAFIDVYVLAAQASKDGKGYGGFAEMQVLGTPAGSDTTPPQISSIQIQKESDTVATVTWTTDEPSTSQVRYSTQTEAPQITAPDLQLTTQHSVKLQTTSPLRGQIELRSADAAGNRAQTRHDAFVTLDTTYQYGVGGWSFQVGDKWLPAPQVYANDGLPLGFTQAWIGGSGWTEWFDAKGVAEIRAAGLTPEVIHYFFGDPKLADVQARRDAFLADIDKLADLLAASGVGDQTIVTLEPEYNQGEVATWDGWNDLMIDAIQRLHSKAGAKVGLLPGDWDIDHVVPISMGRAAAQADFVAFQEMRASTQDTEEEAGQVVSRAIRFSHYLSRRFLRPVRWGYLMVSDYGNWTYVQRKVVVELCERTQELKDAGVIAVSWMSYADHPGSDGYFKEGEAHKGLKFSNLQPKPAFHVWKECVLNGPSWLSSGQPPPAEPPEQVEESGCSCRIATTRGAWSGIALALLGCAAVWRARKGGVRRRGHFPP